MAVQTLAPLVPDAVQTGVPENSKWSASCVANDSVVASESGSVTDTTPTTVPGAEYSTTLTLDVKCAFTPPWLTWVTVTV